MSRTTLRLKRGGVAVVVGIGLSTTGVPALAAAATDAPARDAGAAARASVPPLLVDPFDLRGLRYEHWPSNYVPDTYRLREYQPGHTPPRVCRGKTGAKLGTAGGPCPAGQAPVARTKRLSTAEADR